MVSARDSLKDFEDNDLLVKGRPTALEKIYDYEPYVQFTHAFVCVQCVRLAL